MYFELILVVFSQFISINTVDPTPSNRQLIENLFTIQADDFDKLLTLRDEAKLKVMKVALSHPDLQHLSQKERGRLATYVADMSLTIERLHLSGKMTWDLLELERVEACSGPNLSIEYCKGMMIVLPLFYSHIIMRAGIITQAHDVIDDINNLLNS